MNLLLKFCFLLQGVVYQLDVALESIDTQRCGLVFIYDMSDSKYSNFDFELSKKILTLLKVSFATSSCFSDVLDSDQLCLMNPLPPCV